MTPSLILAITLSTCNNEIVLYYRLRGCGKSIQFLPTFTDISLSYKPPKHIRTVVTVNRFMKRFSNEKVSISSLFFDTIIRIFYICVICCFCHVSRGSYIIPPFQAKVDTLQMKLCGLIQHEMQNYVYATSMNSFIHSF